jgi:hypothetical protein
MVLPEVRYDFFNPTSRRYEYATTPSLRLTVAATTGAVADTTAVPRDTIGDTPFPAIAKLARSNALVIAIAATAIAVILFGILLLSRRRGGGDQDDEE